MLLNETGRGQARELAARLAGQHFQAVYSSDLKRAYETAQILSGSLGLPVRVDYRLREICQGEWEGLQVAEINGRYAAHVARYQDRPQDAHAPGGESVREVAARVALAADSIALACPAGPVLVVSHGLALAALYCLSHQIDLGEAYQHIPANGQPAMITWPPLAAS